MTTTTTTKCLVCDGSGTAEYDKPVTDYERGGYIGTYRDDCDECEGEGEVNILSASSVDELLLAIRTAEKILEDADIVDNRLDDIYGHIKEARQTVLDYMKYYNYD